MKFAPGITNSRYILPPGCTKSGLCQNRHRFFWGTFPNCLDLPLCFHQLFAPDGCFNFKRFNKIKTLP